MSTMRRIMPLSRMIVHSSVKSTCLSEPPRISTVDRVMVCTALMVESALVPLESLMKRTPLTSRTNSMRCSTPWKVRNVCRMTGTGTP